MMIHQPDWISQDLVDGALATAAKKKSLPALDAVRFLPLTEGRCVQTLHIGSYDDEGPVLERMHHQYMPEHGLTFAGKHHEIYLGDPRKVEAMKLKTLLRQPVVAAH